MMKYTNENSFKAKIKNIAQEKGISAQQMQQNYLIEQILKLISYSKYKNNFIVKGGYLISCLIGVENRTTMDLDLTLKDMPLSESDLHQMFDHILNQDINDTFTFAIDTIRAIRADDIYGGYRIKINAIYGRLHEVVFIDITTGDVITPSALNLTIPSAFANEEICIVSYNLETVLAEKIETVISRGEGSSRPRDRYDILNLWRLHQSNIDREILKHAILNTSAKRDTQTYIYGWKQVLGKIKVSKYQQELWMKYQQSYKYAKEISFHESVDVIDSILCDLI